MNFALKITDTTESITAIIDDEIKREDTPVDWNPEWAHLDTHYSVQQEIGCFWWFPVGVQLDQWCLACQKSASFARRSELWEGIAFDL